MSTSDVKAQLTVSVSGTEKTFTAVASTEADPFKVARGLVYGITTSARDWLYEVETPTLGADVEVKVQLTVAAAGQEKSFPTVSSTDANPFQVARSLALGIQDSACSWLADRRDTALTQAR